MAPPEHPFPTSSLPARLHSTLDADGRPQSRKLRHDFDLRRDCPLLELVQYSCTPWQDSLAGALEGSGRRQECWPVVRLFRRCRENGKMFHVETTAWEGEGACELGSHARKEKEEEMTATKVSSSRSRFAEYGSYFWTR